MGSYPDTDIDPNIVLMQQGELENREFSKLQRLMNILLHVYFKLFLLLSFKN